MALCNEYQVKVKAADPPVETLTSQQWLVENDNIEFIFPEFGEMISIIPVPYTNNHNQFTWNQDTVFSRVKE
jgi:hypothetical protein